MVVINLAYTQPINPEGAEIVLSRSQVWKGKRTSIYNPSLPAAQKQTKEKMMMTSHPSLTHVPSHHRPTAQDPARAGLRAGHHVDRRAGR